MSIRRLGVEPGRRAPVIQAISRSPEPRSLELTLLRLQVSHHERNESRMAVTHAVMLSVCNGDHFIETFDESFVLAEFIRGNYPAERNG